ncbi:3'-phosphatase, 5'-polynucleotide kinase, phage-associated [Yersinia phage fHe-Yen9-04]|uniref:3'-phosphatase, 5'-polynucleotide kinase, phage-associated n=1 Tax=Yersinia phage fHe-Yen9-04 TaxID=2052742 RepID=A0A2C9CX27_9CAUD|nr:polynucleotide kinase [Yersinia phage fHe-Yen9-04]SOK58341.1 3'-phosphatase, 5'-polynucleotide kinase, phage-associated [Yersinia phage fHe-Yen9-04]VUE36110.1 3'-phosphatase, 5'-polynucleotide kinase, phage-associated [Yersinia phage fHe-Yen9-04]
MPTLTLTVGLPGCGKTTWANEQVRTSRSKTVNVNLDDVRQTMAGSHSNYKFRKDNEQYVQNAQYSAAEHAAVNGWNIIVSDTNLNPTVRNKWKEFAKKYNYTYKEHSFLEEYKKDKTFEHNFFAVKGFVKQCKERNLLREKSVPEDVIDGMAEKYFYNTMKVETSTVFDLEDVIIVDIDGTLAHMDGKRGPYEENKVLLDTPDSEVILSVLAEKNYLGRKVIVMSGRHVTCQEDTEAWLQKYGVPYDHIFMRKADDNRSDDIVKYELYMEHVHNKYNVAKIYDDRDQVCFMWRHLLGLKVLQVAEGNF